MYVWYIHIPIHLSIGTKRSFFFQLRMLSHILSHIHHNSILTFYFYFLSYCHFNKMHVCTYKYIHANIVMLHLNKLYFYDLQVMMKIQAEAVRRNFKNSSTT